MARPRLVIPRDPPPRPTRRQAESVHAATARINVWEGSIRSGKTVASVVAWLAYVAGAPPGELAIIGKTERAVARNVLPVIASLVPYERTEGGIILLGRMVWIVGANDAKAEGKLRGMTLAGAYVDEATLLPPDFWRQLLNRMSVPGARLLATTNPDSPHHWLLTEYLEATGLNLRRFRFTLRDATFLDPDYIAALEAENTGLWRRRFILGEWVAAEGAVYDLLDRDVHGYDLGPTPTTRWVALDYGTTNPTHAVLLGRLPSGQLVAEAEWRYSSKATGRTMTDAAQVDALLAWAAKVTNPPDAGPERLAVRPSRWVVDPSAASLIAELRSRGTVVVEADNSVVDGIRTVASLLGDPTAGTPPRLLISHRCAELWTELEGYTWDPKAQLKGEDAPLKVNDHGPDALRYGIMAARTTAPVVMAGSAG